TNARVEWLLGLLPQEALRGRVVRALGHRPEGLSVDVRALRRMLASALPPRNGSAGVAMCADTATLRPFTDPGLSLAMLGTAGTGNYQGENWLQTCVHWLSPSSQGASDGGRGIAGGDRFRPSAGSRRKCDFSTCDPC